MLTHLPNQTKEQNTSSHGSAHTNIEPASPLHHPKTSHMHIGDPHSDSDTNQHKISHHQQEMDKIHAAAAAIKATSSKAVSKPKMEDDVKIHNV